MGAEFWSYVVPWQEDVAAALEKLREEEFRAGRYWQPAEAQPGFVGRLLGRPAGKPKLPASIKEALKGADATGTRSILDMERISSAPEPGAMSRMPDVQLKELFGTTQPTKEMIEHSDEFFEGLERGEGVYIVLYEEGKPTSIYFAGYSFD